MYLNTIVDESKGKFSFEDDGKIARWTLLGMNILPERFGEYNTTDTAGNVISPASNTITFTYKDNSKSMETILTATEAAAYEYGAFFGEWNPANESKQEMLYYTIENGAIVWEETAATLFLIEKDGVASLSSELPATIEEGMSVRAANGRGGFGAPAVNGKRPLSIESTTTKSHACKRIENGQVVIYRDATRYSVLGAKVLH